MHLPEKIATLLPGVRPAARISGPDGFEYAPDDPLAEAHNLISHLLAAALAAAGGARFLSQAQFEATPTWMEAAELPPEALVRLARAAALRQRYNSQAGMPAVRDQRRVLLLNLLEEISRRVVERRPPFRISDTVEILEALNEHYPPAASWMYPWLKFLAQVERLVAREGLPPELRRALEQLRKAMASSFARLSDEQKIVRRIDNILWSDRPLRLPDDDPWSAALLADWAAMTSQDQQAWRPLLDHAAALSAAHPSAKWLKLAAALVEQIGAQRFAAQLRLWLGRIRHNGNQPLPPAAAELLRGLLWMASDLESPTLAHAAGDAALACYYKIPNQGPRSQVAGNACTNVLGTMPGLAAVGELLRIRQQVKRPEVQRLAAQNLAQAADRLGLTAADLEDLAVPDYGLDTSGERRAALGEFQALLKLGPAGEVSLAWYDAGGRPRKSVPAAVQREFKTELAELKAAQKALRAGLSAQRARLEGLLVSQRTWDFADWQERCLAQPLVGCLARRLIWHCRDGERAATGIPLDGRLVDALGQPLDWVGPGCELRLWHPLGFPVETVLGWRRFLEERQVRQPFKQAHRELYLLTDAEVETATHSNRFAAHILKQHQFHALCQQRGWRSQLRGGFDQGYDRGPTLDLPQAGLQAQFWVEGLMDDLAGSGICLYVATDQVRFYTAGGTGVPLSEVPALVFSEVLRDVDLFVGVCSIGSDPNWRPHGDQPAYADYWQRYAFGALSVSAENRREILGRLVPRLKIAGRCELQERYLRVQGKRRAYKIHLGSGNILMEPNDQYLCIVPARTAEPANVFLPFDGDPVLAVILSKAFLLADDDQITDPTILSQIRR